MYKETYQKEEVKDIMQDIIMRIEDEARYHGRLGGEPMEYAFRKAADFVKIELERI